MSIQKTKTNPFSVDASPTHRVGLTENEIVELLTLLHDTKVTVGISRLLMSANLKLNNVYEKASIGKKAPDYVPTGKRRESQFSLESLGADTPMPPSSSSSSSKPSRTDEDINKDNIIADKMMELMSGGLDLDEAQAQAEAWYMKGADMSTGTNSASTVLHDPDISTDNDSIHTFLMQNQTLTTDQF